MEIVASYSGGLIKHHPGSFLFYWISIVELIDRERTEKMHGPHKVAKELKTMCVPHCRESPRAYAVSCFHL